MGRESASREATGRGERGAGMTEYIILVGLIAILLIGAVKMYKEQVRVTIEGGSIGVRDNVRSGIPSGEIPPVEEDGEGDEEEDEP